MMIANSWLPPITLINNEILGPYHTKAIHNCKIEKATSLVAFDTTVASDNTSSVKENKGLDKQPLWREIVHVQSSTDWWMQANILQGH